MCNKKSYKDKWNAKQALFAILKNNKKAPWRDELSVYLCDDCNKYHISSKPTEYIPLKLRNKSYFEIQKDKWSDWLHNYSAKGAVIKKINKKYST